MVGINGKSKPLRELRLNFKKVFKELKKMLIKLTIHVKILKFKQLQSLKELLASHSQLPYSAHMYPEAITIISILESEEEPMYLGQ